MAIEDVMPFVLAPVQHEGLAAVDAELARECDGFDLPVVLPNFDWTARRAVAVALRDFGDEIENDAVGGRAQKFQVLRVCPHQGHRSPGRPAETHQRRRQVGPVQTCSGNSRVEVAKFSIARRYGMTSRPAANS